MYAPQPDGCGRARYVVIIAQLVVNSKDFIAELAVLIVHGYCFKPNLDSHSLRTSSAFSA
jgi:hypothetical protein